MGFISKDEAELPVSSTISSSVFHELEYGKVLPVLLYQFHPELCHTPNGGMLLPWRLV